MQDIIRGVIRSDTFQTVDVGTVSGQIERITMIKDAGLPPMRVVPGSYILNNRRIPKYSDPNSTIDALDCFKKPGVSIFYFSHRWLRENEPDDENNTKANALAEFINFYRTYKEFQSDPNGIYFFIDYSSIDQANPEPGKMVVPLYIASCKLFVSFVTTDYYSRAWCNIERGLSKAFTKYGATPWIIGAGFKSLPDGNGDFKMLSPSRLVPDPSTLGEVSLQSDRPILEFFEKIASEDAMTPILWGMSTVSELEALSTPAPALDKKPIRILAVSPAGVGMTTLIRQAADAWGSGFTEDGKDRRTKTYEHHFVSGDRHVSITELGVAATALKTLQKMLLMIGGGDRSASASSGGGSFDLVLFVVSLDECDQFSDSGENKLVSSTQMFGTVQRSVGAGTPSLVVFNMTDKFSQKEDVKSILEATTADYNSSLEPMDYFKKLFVQRNFGKGKLNFASCSAIDRESALAVFGSALSILS